MAEEGEKKYKLITENRETKDTSRGCTGKATAFYTNGDKYEGDFLDGIRQGRGIYRYDVNGNNYEGDWVENAKHGIGKMIYRKKNDDDGKITFTELGEYHGYWENNRRHGEGVFTYPNGDIYSGWWRFGDKEGKGTYIFKETGMKMHGDWEKGEIKRGCWIYPNGLYFEGEFKNNKPEGKGVWYFKNGNKLHGHYEQKPKELGEDEEPPEEDGEDGAVAKPKFDLVWHTEAKIAEAAANVNSVEQ